MLRLQVRIPDRVAGRVVFGERRLPKAVSGGRAQPSTTGQPVGRPRAICSVRPEAFVVLQPHSGRERHSCGDLAHDLRIKGTVPTRRVDRRRGAVAEGTLAQVEAAVARRRLSRLWNSVLSLALSGGLTTPPSASWAARSSRASSRGVK